MQAFLSCFLVMFIFSILFLPCTVQAQVKYSVDFNQKTGEGSPYVFGATQPRGLSDHQWDLLVDYGFTIVRSQADLSELVSCSSAEGYLQNKNGCAEVRNWNFKEGIYGKNYAQRAIERGLKVILTYKTPTGIVIRCSRG